MFLFLIYQPIDEKIQTWNLRFHAKENPDMEKTLFDWPIVLQYDDKAKYWLISRKFSGVKFFQPSSFDFRLTNPKATRVCIRSINHSNRSISVRFLFLFCSRVVISRSYENRSNKRSACCTCKVFQTDCTIIAPHREKRRSWWINSCSNNNTRPYHSWYWSVVECSSPRQHCPCSLWRGSLYWS